MSLHGKVAVVLGASARGGTGWAVAESLAAEGAKVVVGARRLELLQQLADQIGGTAVRCDAARPEDIAHLARTAVEQHGQIHVAVSCASETARGLISEIDPATVQRSLEVNYIGNFHFIRHMAAAMTGGGAITLISSAVSAQPVADRFAYGSSKAAMDCLVRHAAIEYGPRGIRVNSILPGPIRSEMVASLLSTPGVKEEFLRQIPIGRIAEPQEIADIIVFLSRIPGYLTGLNLPVSGGMHLTQPPPSRQMKE